MNETQKATLAELKRKMEILEQVSKMTPAVIAHNAQIVSEAADRLRYEMLEGN